MSNLAAGAAMRGMILAAGRGERMGELTQTTPKPLLRVGGRYLIEHAIAQFQRANIREIVINVSYLGEQIIAAIGDGARYGVQIAYSQEKERLETGGGILQALPHLGDAPFVVVSADIISDYPLAQLPSVPEGLAHLVVVDNPSFNSHGDFGLRDGFADRDAHPYYTFANIGVYHPALFAHATPGHFRLFDLVFPAMARQLVTAEHFSQSWYNIGSPTELARAHAALCVSASNA